MQVKIKEDNKSEKDIFLGMQYKRPKRISVYIHFKNYQIILKLIIYIYQFVFVIILQLNVFS